MNRVADALFALLKVAMVACLALMVVLVFGNVVLRYGFNQGITVSEEMSRMLFVWLTFIAAVVAMREHAHLGLDTLVRHLSPAGKKACFVASHVLVLAACVLFLQGSWKQTVISYQVGAIAPVTGMSMTFFYGTGIFFSVCAAAITVHELYRLVTGRLAESELVTVREAVDEPTSVPPSDDAGGPPAPASGQRTGRP